MERSGLLRWLLLGLGIFLVLQVFDPFGSKEVERQPLKPEGVTVPEARAQAHTCDIWTDKYRAVFTTRGASLKHFQLLSAKYRRDGQPIDLSTTPDLDFYRQLRFHFRNPAAASKQVDWQVDYDLVDWQIVRQDGKTCEFVYRDAETELRKLVRASGRAYEVEVRTTVKNLADRPLRHAATLHTAAWRTTEEVEGGMFRVSPFVTQVECVMNDGEAVRLKPSDFEGKDFEAPEFSPSALNPGDWHQPPGTPNFASISNAYFTHAIMPVSSPKGAPVCQLQIEQRFDAARFKSPSADPNGGAMYRARLAYPSVDLEPGASAEYVALSYVGPKERDVLAAAGGGEFHLDEVIDLGFFTVIAKVIVAFLLQVHSVIPNWGIAIIVLTICVRMLLFPLSIPSIKSMVKMRELKPELDALNQKYKDDPQAKGLAQMELWRKHKVNPLKGCLPQLASMPVWIALYTTLQTAVELYNTQFLWFPDLSERDPYFILPFVIGGTAFVQQKLMPMQADPTQQKMMMYFMPAMFTVFMLFLPAGLGVYMFTNSVLGIIQQQAVEWHMRRTSGGGSGQIEVKLKEEPAGKSKKDRPKGDKAKLSDGRQVLGKGKA